MPTPAFTDENGNAYYAQPEGGYSQTPPPPTSTSLSSQQLAKSEANFPIRIPTIYSDPDWGNYCFQIRK